MDRRKNTQTLFGSRVGSKRKRSAHIIASIREGARKGMLKAAAIHREQGKQRLDSFADFLAENMSVRDAAKAVGWTEAHGRNMFGKMRKALGWQAS